jgi:hypothetical protein
VLLLEVVLLVVLLVVLRRRLLAVTVLLLLLLVALGSEGSVTAALAAVDAAAAAAAAVPFAASCSRFIVLYFAARFAAWRSPTSLRGSTHSIVLEIAGSEQACREHNIRVCSNRALWGVVTAPKCSRKGAVTMLQATHSLVCLSNLV